MQQKGICFQGTEDATVAIRTWKNRHNLTPWSAWVQIHTITSLVSWSTNLAEVQINFFFIMWIKQSSSCVYTPQLKNPVISFQNKFCSIKSIFKNGFQYRSCKNRLWIFNFIHCSTELKMQKWEKTEKNKFRRCENCQECLIPKFCNNIQ